MSEFILDRSGEPCDTLADCWEVIAQLRARVAQLESAGLGHRELRSVRDRDEYLSSARARTDDETQRTSRDAAATAGASQAQIDGDAKERLGHFSARDGDADCTGAILVRGPVTNGAIMGTGATATYGSENLAHTLRFLLGSQPVHHCIVYSHFEGTRDGGSTPLLGVLRRFNKTTHPRGRFSYVLSKPACTSGTAHRNSNKLAILAGLKLLRAMQPRARWVLHTRADLP